MESFILTETIPASPEDIFNAWMDSRTHSEMTGDTAIIEHRSGGSFSVFSGYITGLTTEISYPARIVQKWRTTEFPEVAPDSDLIISFSRDSEGCTILLEHSNVPDGQAERYKQGWKDYYFEPMKAYFSQ